MLLIMLRTRTWHHLEAVGFLHQETENFKFWPILRFFHKKLDHKEKCNQTNERKKNNLIVQIMKIGENCEESWSCLSYTALDLAWCDLKGQKRLLTWLQRSFFCNLASKYNMNWRQEIQIIWSLSSKNLHKNRHKSWSFVQRK